ncbi:GNAT family N-acetyltransferase [Deinococcus cellulosilyticus]|uniref:N-acetyltransferase n=1 Tax=Deinococcus cellulosilyticus (strain DSM 18568 / NBRC 106333 / KACC 11606 / 5516J-15) TaxID=1223518 RepID=A0A511MYI7_DEIC1|nr:GNAT family N-acetyltransferase [Deinococcus cellulosilyticus]GEM45348.1 N-acetyltransferase [Deinococcus cellulosilyticus NBRC 106333 = KACC 11606]
MTPRIRLYQPEDLEALYHICLKTGDNGGDATHLYRDPKLLGHYYAAPYGVLFPETCLVLEDEEGVCGYIVGTPDSHVFEQRTEAHWWPALREQYALPGPEDQSLDARMIRAIHRGYQARGEAEDFPAHLHIDLLPRAQGGGNGKRLMLAFLDLLRSQGIRGVHLGVSRDNPRAVAFYHRMGFQTLQEHPWSYDLGMHLSPQSGQ